MKTYTADEYVTEAARDIAEKLLYDMVKNGEKIGANRALDFAHNFVGIFLGGALAMCLRLESGQPMTEEQEYEFTANNLNAFKSNIQNAISIAFDKVMSEYTGLDVTYHCQIQALDGPSNKYPC